MRSVTVQKDELREIIEHNREEHEAIFQEAVEGYRAQAVKLLEEHIERIRTGQLVNVHVSMPRPVNHIKDYDRVLKMLKMSIEDVVEIDEDSFGAYVMDDWHWKDAFLASNSAYSRTAERLSRKSS